MSEFDDIRAAAIKITANPDEHLKERMRKRAEKGGMSRSAAKVAAARANLARVRARRWNAAAQLPPAPAIERKQHPTAASQIERAAALGILIHCPVCGGNYTPAEFIIKKKLLKNICAMCFKRKCKQRASEYWDRLKNGVGVMREEDAERAEQARQDILNAD